MVLSVVFNSKAITCCVICGFFSNIFNNCFCLSISLSVESSIVSLEPSFALLLGHPAPIDSFIRTSEPSFALLLGHPALVNSFIRTSEPSFAFLLGHWAFVSPTSPKFSNGNIKHTLSGFSFSVISGIAKSVPVQALKIIGKPLPARSPIFIRLNIFIKPELRGSEIPPFIASSKSILNVPALVIVILVMFLSITTPVFS